MKDTDSQDPWVRHKLDDEYLNHSVFGALDIYKTFYHQWSDSVMSFPTLGTNSIISIDSLMYSSTEGTMESIKDVLLKGRINDAYALLRKYYDIVIINIYISLYLDEHHSIDNFIVSKIDDWVKGVKDLPRFGTMSNYVIRNEQV